MSLSITAVSDLVTALGECPSYAEGRFWLMDCRKGLIFTLEDGAACPQFALPAPTGSYAHRAGGGLAVALKDEILLIGPDGGQHVAARLDHSHPNLRFNDSCLLPDGGFLVGTMHVLRGPGEAPIGGIYRLGPDLDFAKVGPALGVANGPLFNPRDGRIYIADSAAKVIWSFAYAEGQLGDQRLFVDCAPLGSAPDGCCLDAEGGLWTALVHGGALVRFDMAGAVSQRIELPLAHPTALCFGGADLEVMLVTSISDSGKLKAEGPMDGRVLEIRGHGRRGLPARQFPG